MMGGRSLPVECEHGVVLDWGDFGPDSDDGSVGAEACPLCFPERLSSLKKLSRLTLATRVRKLKRKQLSQGARLREAKAEVTRLRQGLWDVYAALGFDTDGDATPDALVYPDIVTLVLNAAKEFRSDVEADDLSASQVADG